MTRQPRQPNERLARLLGESGMSHKGLAARVVRLGAARGHDLRYNHSSVARWLRGETPRPPTPGLVAEVMSAVLSRQVEVADLGMAPEQIATDDAALLQIPQNPDDGARNCVISLAVI